MKSEERHQLLKNDLSVVTTNTVGFVEQHMGTMIAVVCVALAVAGIATYLARTAGSENAAGWTMLDSAANLEDFGDVADKFKGKPPGQWAQLQIAEKTLQNAMPLMFSNREIALNDLKRCREGFESLLQDKTVPAIIRERALWGLALCLETACDGDTSKPVQAFERLITEFPDSIFKIVAEERIAALKKSDAGEFYAWFSKENPKPPAPAGPRDIKPDGIDLPAPKSPDDERDDFGPDMPVKPANDKPETTPAAEEKKDEAKPGDKPESDKPADPVKPVEGEKPTGTEPPKDGQPKEGEKPSEKK